MKRVVKTVRLRMRKVVKTALFPIVLVFLIIILFEKSEILGRQVGETINLLATSAAAIGIFQLAYQISLQMKERKNQAVALLFDDMVNPEFREKLAFVYSHKVEDLELSKLSQDDLRIVEDVTGRYDGLGWRVKNGLIPKEETLQLFWDSILRSAQQLHCHIKDQRMARKEEKLPEDVKYKADFEWLAKECKRFQLKRMLIPKKEWPNEGASIEDWLKIEPLTIFETHR